MVRDQEVAGSNPVTPTVTQPLLTTRFALTAHRRACGISSIARGGSTTTNRPGTRTMKRRAISYPARPHKSGQARVKLAGKDHYLGVWGTPESKVRFYRLLAEHCAGGAAGEPESRGITVAELLDAFLLWAQ